MKSFPQQHQPSHERASYPLQQQQKGPATVQAAQAAAPAPPVTERQSEVASARNAERQMANRRKGFKASLLAGETGGWMNEQNPAPKSLLG